MANSIQMKVNNILSVIDLVQRQPGISKPQIGNELSLVPSTVQGIVAKLQTLGVLRLFGTADSTGGRRAQQYEINPHHRSIIAVSILPQKAQLGVFDLSLHCLGSETLSLSLQETGPEAYVGLLSHQIQKLLIDTGVACNTVAGIGVSLPGPADSSAGVVTELYGAELWKDFPLGKRLAEALSLPVLVDKDVYMGAQYLDYTQQIEPEQTTLYVSILEGVGSALIHKGSVFRGPHGLAGEIGHITIRRDGARCHCGNIGCVELYCSESGLLTQYNVQSQQRLLHIGELIEQAQAGDETSMRVFVQSVRYLTDVLSSLMLICDPDKILLNCRWLNGQKSLYLNLLDGLYAKSIFTRRHATEIELLPPRGFALCAGAAAVAKQYLLSPESPLIASCR